MAESKSSAIVVEGVYKDFKLPHQRKGTIKSVFTGMFERKKTATRTFETQHALKNISFDVKKGEFFGIVGRNGSGKSTLLKILAGIYQPNRGNVHVSGSLVPFIELGVGFNPELTGRENVFLNGAMLGFDKKKIMDMYDDIVRFAELERFMDQKLKNYSSGMQVRLAFSMAIRADADILLVDEVLAVGDADFQRKCFDYFRKLKKDKKTVVFVSHDMSAVREYCDKAVLIEKNEIVCEGTSDEVATQYTRMFFDNNFKGFEADSGNEKRWGDGSIKFTDVKLLEDSENIVIKFVAKANDDISKPNFGFTIRSAAGDAVLGTNLNIKRKSIPIVKKGTKVEIEWRFPNILNDGKYYIEPAVVHPNGEVCDWWEEAKVLSVKKVEKTPYAVNPDINVEVNIL